MAQTSDPRPVLLLLDGHSLAYRAFYALPDTMRTRSGQLTNAVFGFTSMLIRLLAERRPDAVAVAFDVGRDVERTTAFPEYKAQREAPPEEFGPQVDLIRDVLTALAIPLLEVPGVEADDVLASVAARGVAAGYRIELVTGDRDAMQLVDEDLTVLYPLKGMSEIGEMTPAAVEERFGVPPSSYVDLAALRGDSSDNLPGVPGVGDKTAAKLLVEFRDIATLYEHLGDVAGKKVPMMLAEHRAQVELNRTLMTLRRDVDVDVSLDALVRGGADRDEVLALFTALEFRSLLDRLDGVLGDADEEVATTTDAAQVTTLAPGALTAWLADASAPVAIVVATSGRPPHVAVEHVALSDRDDRAAVLAMQEASTDDVARLRAWLADASATKVTHEAKRLEHAAAALDATVAGLVMDTELGAYLLEPERRGFDLPGLVRDQLGRRLDDAASDQVQLSLDVGDGGGHRAGTAAAVLLALAASVGDDLAERDQSSLLADIELPLVPILASLERTGIAVDLTVLDGLRDRFVGRIAQLEHEIHDHAGRTFNVGSNPQLQEVLFEELGLPRTRRIKTGHTTDAAALGELVGHHPIVGAILDWRELTKLLTTYVDALPPLVDRATGRIHTTLSQTVAATGRLASSNPNLQNIPVRGSEGREIRRAFVAGEGYATLLIADYSQIELRILAHLSGDEGLLDAFASGEDIHATTAANVFDTPLTEVDATLRDRAKAVNYGIAYGLTAFGLARQLGIANDEAQAIVDAYYARFPKVKAFLDDAVEAASRDGHTTTLFGRRRYLPDLTSSDRTRRQMAERMAMNAPIQGTAADVIKLAMIALERALRDAGLRSRQLLQVHDEVILEVVEGEQDRARDVTRAALEGVADLAVPLVVDTAFGATWFDAQKH